MRLDLTGPTAVYRWLAVPLPRTTRLPADRPGTWWLGGRGVWRSGWADAWEGWLGLLADNSTSNYGSSILAASAVTTTGVKIAAAAVEAAPGLDHRSERQPTSVRPTRPARPRRPGSTSHALAGRRAWSSAPTPTGSSSGPDAASGRARWCAPRPAARAAAGRSSLSMSTGARLISRCTRAFTFSLNTAHVCTSSVKLAYCSSRFALVGTRSRLATLTVASDPPFDSD